MMMRIALTAASQFQPASINASSPVERPLLYRNWRRLAGCDERPSPPARQETGARSQGCRKRYFRETRGSVLRFRLRPRFFKDVFH